MNCAEGKATTVSGFHNINTSTKGFILLHQESSITENRQSPKAHNKDMFLPYLHKPKCTTYVQKDLEGAWQPIIQYHDCILAISLLTNDKPMQFFNVHASKKVEAPVSLATHRPQHESLLAGDFNTHNMAWYGERKLTATAYFAPVRATLTC